MAIKINSPDGKSIIELEKKVSDKYPNGIIINSSNKDSELTKVLYQGNDNKFYLVSLDGKDIRKAEGIKPNFFQDIANKTSEIFGGTGSTGYYIYKNKDGKDIKVNLDWKVDKNIINPISDSINKTGTGSTTQNKEFKPLNLTRTETASLPKEYIDLYAKMANGQMGNNQYRRPVIAGGNDTGGGQATNFLGAILQGAAEGVGNNIEKWSSSEQGKSDFWNRIVPALEKASGRKITGLSDQQYNDLNKKYIEAQTEKNKLGEKMDDKTLANIADSVVQNKQKLEEAQQMTPTPYYTMDNPVDYAKARLDQSQLEQQQAQDKNKRYDDLSTYLSQLQSQALSNEGGTQVGTGADIGALQNVQNAQAMLPVSLEKAKQDAINQLNLYAMKMNIQLDKDVRLLQARKDILGENSINGVNNILGQIMNLQTPQTPQPVK